MISRVVHPLLLTVWISSSVLGLDRCLNAPEEGIRIICEQITRWDKDSRTVAPLLKPFNSIRTAPSESLNKNLSSFYDCMDISCLCAFFGGLMRSDWCRLPDGKFLGRALRKEYRQMTDQERSNYHAATWKMRKDGTYGELSRIHSNFTIAAGAHSGPAFLPWHREYIKRMEFALREIDPTIALPYWDSTLDNNIPNPLDSVLWGDELMGYPSLENTLLSGSFSHWRTDDNTRYVRRCLGEQAALMNEEHIRSFMAFTNIDDIMASTASRAGCPRPASWSSLEYTHGNPHVYVGGDMLATTNSTNDPLFFLHHSFIDLLWEEWRQSKQSSIERETAYPVDNAACSSLSHFSNSIMRPFAPLTNSDGLSNKYSELYSYLERPSCSAKAPDCKSRFLFCDLSHGSPRCASRIRRGGNCTGFENGEFPCYEGECLQNICSVNDIPTSSERAISTATTSTTIIQQTLHTSSTTTSRTIGNSSVLGAENFTIEPFTIATTTFSAIGSSFRPSTSPSEICLNDNHCCQGWADYGECEKNPGYMRKHCKASCNVCSVHINHTIECDNRVSDCDVRVANSGCSTPWMYENCRQQCGMCHQTRKWQCTLMGTSTHLSPEAKLATQRMTTSSSTSTIVRTSSKPNPIARLNITSSTPSTVSTTIISTSFRIVTDPIKTSVSQSPLTQILTCWNYHYCCEAWASENFCISRNNSAYMKHYCAPSCNTCKQGANPYLSKSSKCQDYHPSCSYWASKDECTLSSGFMYENCKLSCGKCELLNLSLRLDTCGFERKLYNSENRTIMSFFKINPWELVDSNSKSRKFKTEFTGV